MKTFEELAKDPMGEKYIDRYDDGIRVVVLRGPGSLCAYLGIPVDHPLAGNNYDDLRVSCNGGLTFGREGDGTYLPKGYFFYGWDYNHCDDVSFSDLTSSYKRSGKQWTVGDVEKELWSAVYDMKALMKIAEFCFQKGAGWRNRAD